jgi:subtilisin family serine protease
MKRSIGSARTVGTAVATAVGIVVALAPGSAAGAGTGPTGVSTVAPQRMVDAVVVLTEQADLSRVRATNRPARLAAVESALRTKAAGSQRGVLALLRARQAQHLVTRVTPLWIVNEVGVRAAPSVIRELAARRDVREIRPDVTIQAPVPAPSVVAGAAAATAAPPEGNVARVNAPGLWDRGYRGQGIVVANMDTGVDVSHPDLAGRWRGGSNSWFDPNGQHPSTPIDVNGHGTETMGVMVGGGAGGTSIGVAPDATWIAVKVFNDRGSTTSTTIHRGFQWLLDPDGNPATADAPHVVNNSWTMSTGGCNLDFQPDLRNLRAAGILPVFSAGNYGPSAGTVLSPANLPEAFAVGGADDADLVDPSSSRGPSACAQAVAPKLAAPGVGIHTTDLYGSYADPTGTSVAAPHVAGALALLLSAFPGLPADRQEAALQAGAVDLGAAGVDSDYGYGRLDVLAAYQWLAATPDFTVAAGPSSVTITPGGTADYAVSATASNGFAADVALSVAGLPTAVGTATITPAVVTGAGSAQLSISTLSKAPAGSYRLTVTGSSGGTSHPAAVTLVVAARDFTLAIAPATRTVARGQSTSYTLTVHTVNGFTGAVSLSVTGRPAGSTVTLSRNPIAAPGTATLTIRTTSSTARGTFTIRVTGTSGSLTHQVTSTLTVR